MSGETKTRNAIKARRAEVAYWNRAARAAMQDGKAAAKANEVPVRTFPVTRWHGPRTKPEEANV